MPKISVIVPVYNVEKYLCECLDSLINQTFTDWEGILINDGSTDSSGKILDDYAKKDSRFSVIHKQNSGYGKSMNLGLEKATGEYISIVEPDDFIDKNMFEDLLQTAKQEKADVVKSNYYTYITKTNKNTPKLGINENLSLHNPTQADILSALKLGPTIWTGLYRAQFLKEHHIKFHETPGASFQDLGFNFKVLIRAKKISLVKKAYYHYRTDNAGSSIRNPNKIFCVCDEFKEVTRYMKEQNCYEELKTILPVAAYSNYMWNYKRLPLKGKLLFLKTFADDFSSFQKSGLLTPQILGNRKYKRILKIIKNPTLFNIIYTIEHLPHNFILHISRIKGLFK